MKTLAEDGHLVAWRVPTHDRIPAPFRLGEFSYAPYTTDNAIIYNTNRLSEEEVNLLASDWRAVLDPRFRGRFAVTSMKCGACYAGIHMFLDPAMRERFGPDFLRAVAAQRPAVYSEVLVGLDRVIAGEHDFTYWTWEAIAIARQQSGAPIRWIRPSPTPEFGNTWQAISRYAPNPNAARLFQTWSMSEEGMRALQQYYGAATTLEGIEDTREVTRQPWYRPIQQRYVVDFDRWDRDFHKDMDQWIRILREAR
jgi:ABC-type Fe3+ transport system substrate-binding protein